ncbi:MAG: hypothetical protein ACRERR_03555 [Moraxellaceae bacterium]
MTANIKLLIVEDVEEERQSWNRKLEMHNADESSVEIHHIFAESLTDAKEKIETQEFDAAIVDIRLKQESNQTGPNTDGNKVVELLVDSEMAVIALFTGESALADIPTKAKAIKTFTKGDGYSLVMSWLISHSQMIFQIKRAKNIIHKEMAKIFTQSIWPRWENWVRSSTGDETHTGNSITRHIVSHLHASLLNEMNQKAHPEEWYFVPPVRDGLRTGDIIKNNDGRIEVVITPRCDLERSGGKNETFQLVECKDISTEWLPAAQKVKDARNHVKSNTDATKTNDLEKIASKAEMQLGEFLQHKKSPIYHFLPKMSLSTETPPIGPFFVCFDKIRSVNRSNSEETSALIGNRVATIASEFLPSLVERLGTYFSRIGTPDYSHPE